MFGQEVRPPWPHPVPVVAHTRGTCNRRKRHSTPTPFVFADLTRFDGQIDRVEDHGLGVPAVRGLAGAGYAECASSHRSCPSVGA
jgi:hypothetical protein